MIIYKITNNVNTKIYIGKTIRAIQSRWKDHLSEARNGSKSRLHNAIRKYGYENFKIEKICKCDNEEQLNRLEIFFILKYKSIENSYGYNIMSGGEGGKMPESSKKKISDSHKGRPKPKSTKDKISKTLTGRPLPEKMLPYLFKKGIIPHNKGAKLTEEERLKCGDWSRAYFSKESNRKKFKNKMLKVMSNEKIKEKLRNKTLSFHKNNPNAGGRHAEKISVLTVEQVMLMREFRKKHPDASYRSIAKKFKAKYDCAIEAIKGKTFKHIPL